MMYKITILLLLLGLTITPVSYAQESYNDLTADEQETLEIEARDQGIDVREYYQTIVNAPQHIQGSSLNEIIIGSFVGLIVIAIAAAYVVRYKDSRKGAISGDAQQDNDTVRAADLQFILKNIIVPFYSNYGRFPTEQEFTDRLSDYDEHSQDPRHGVHVPGQSGSATFGYFYTQYNSRKNTNDAQYFKLWCYLSTGKVIGYDPRVLKR